MSGITNMMISFGPPAAAEEPELVCIENLQKLGDTTVWSSPDGNASVLSSEIDGSVIHQQTCNYSSAVTCVVINISGTNYFTRWTRDIDLTGSQLTEASTLVPTIGNNTQAQTLCVQNSSSIQISRQPAAGSGLGVSAWIIDGVQGDNIRPPEGTDHYHAAFRSSAQGNNGAMYVPGAGIYVANGNNPYWLTRYDAPTDAVPTVFIDVGSGVRGFAGYDEDGNVYAFDTTETLYRYSADLELLDTFAAPIGVQDQSLIVACGRYWCVGESSGDLHVYDLNDSLTLLDTLTVDGNAHGSPSMVPPHLAYYGGATDLVRIAEDGPAPAPKPTAYFDPSDWTLVEEWDTDTGDLTFIFNTLNSFVRNTGFAWSPNGTKLTIGNSSDDVVRTFQCTTPFDPNSANAVLETRSVTNPTNLFFTNGGTRMLYVRTVGDVIAAVPASNYTVTTLAETSQIGKGEVGFNDSGDGAFVPSADASYVLWWGETNNVDELKYVTFSPPGDLDNFTVQETVTNDFGANLFSDRMTPLSADETRIFTPRFNQVVAMIEMPAPHDIANISIGADVDLGPQLADNWAFSAGMWIDPLDTRYVWVAHDSSARLAFAKFDTHADRVETQFELQTTVEPWDGPELWGQRSNLTISGNTVTQQTYNYDSTGSPIFGAKLRTFDDGGIEKMTRWTRTFDALTGAQISELSEVLDAPLDWNSTQMIAPQNSHTISAHKTLGSGDGNDSAGWMFNGIRGNTIGVPPGGNWPYSVREEQQSTIYFANDTIYGLAGDNSPASTEFCTYIGEQPATGPSTVTRLQNDVVPGQSQEIMGHDDAGNVYVGRKGDINGIGTHKEIVKYSSTGVELEVFITTLSGSDMGFVMFDNANYIVGQNSTSTISLWTFPNLNVIGTLTSIPSPNRPMFVGRKHLLYGSSNSNPFQLIRVLK